VNNLLRAVLGFAGCHHDGRCKVVSLGKRGRRTDRVGRREQGHAALSRWTVRGTHQGEFFGVAGMGNRVEFTGIQIDRLEESKIVEEWAEFDLLGAMRQMGAVREP
jgi:hypothetical protein